MIIVPYTSCSLNNTLACGMKTPLLQNFASDSVSVLVEEITSLVDKVDSIDSRFLKVKQILAKTTFDPDGNFAQYRKEYLELVWKSREIAGKGDVAGKDFCGDLLDLVLLDTNTSKEEKIRELEIAIGSWCTDNEQCSQLSHDFKELSNKLKAFRTAFSERVALDSEAEARVSSEIDRLDAKITHTNVQKSMVEQHSLIFSWIIDMFRYLLGPGGPKTSGGQHVTSKEDLRRQKYILEGKLRDIQLVINKRDDILGEVDATTADMDSLSSEITSLSAIFNLMTSECTELLAVMRSDAPAEDLAAQIVELRKEFSPIQKSLSTYARAQKR